MRRIQNTRNGRIACITDTYKKGDVVITYELTYEDDGKTTNLSSSTIRRWWKDIEPVEQDTVALAVEVESETKDEEVASDGTPYSQVMSEILEDEKAAVDKKEVKKDEKKARKNGKSKVVTEQKSDRSSIKQHIISIADEYGFESKEYTKMPNLIVFKAFGRGRVEARVGKNALTLNVKEDVAISSKLPYHTINNYYLPAVIQFSYESDYDTELKNLFTLAYEKSENTKKSQKEEK